MFSSIIYSLELGIHKQEIKLSRYLTMRWRYWKIPGLKGWNYYWDFLTQMIQEMDKMILIHYHRNSANWWSYWAVRGRVLKQIYQATQSQVMTWTLRKPLTPDFQNRLEWF